MLKTIAMLSALSLSSAATQGIDRQYHYNESSSSFKTYDQDAGFKWREQGPIELIGYLKSGAIDWNKKKPRQGFRAGGTHYGWIQTEDIPGLIALLDFKEPCLPVAMSISSWMDTELSTVGQEAAYLIEGYRLGKYPHALNSTRWAQTRTDQDRYRFKEWCDTFMRAYATQPKRRT